jgi:hypothetical protein
VVSVELCQRALLQLTAGQDETPRVAGRWAGQSAAEGRASVGIKRSRIGRGRERGSIGGSELCAEAVDANGRSVGADRQTMQGY